MKVPQLTVGKQLICGVTADPILALGQAPLEIRGSGLIEGPLIVGNHLKFGGSADNASLLLSNCTNLDAQAPAPPLSILKVRSSLPPTPIDVVLGDVTGPVGVTIYGGPLAPFTVASNAITLETVQYTTVSKNSTKTSSIVQDVGSKVFTGSKTENGADHNVAVAFNSAPLLNKTFSKARDFSSDVTTLNGTFQIATKALAKAKNFDVPHPTKEGWRLRHTCPEGPTNDVYIRGKLNGKNIIELPEYWRGLVNPETITVNLTPMGSYQELYYEMGPWSSSVKVMNSAGGPINCSYLIHAERVDVEKLIPEYEGTTPQDYPGDNSQYVINGGINNQTS